MATVTITNLTNQLLPIPELYIQIQPLTAINIQRYQSELTQMKGLQAAVAAGKATVTVTYSADELASGIGGGGDEPFAFPKTIASANITAAGALEANSIGFVSATKQSTGNYKLVLQHLVPEIKRVIQVSASSAQAEFVYCDDSGNPTTTDVLVHVRDLPSANPVDGGFAITVLQNAE